jgi:hypothetical protein
MKRERIHGKRTGEVKNPFLRIFRDLKMRQKPFVLLIVLLLGAAPGLKAKILSDTVSSAPPIPTGFMAEAKGTGIQLSWDKLSLAGVRFNLHLADEMGKMGRKLTARPITDDWVFLEKVKPTRVYHFVLTAVNSEGIESKPTVPLEAQLADLQKSDNDTDSESVMENGSGPKGEDQEEDKNEPFKPNWTGQAAYTFSSQDTLGQGEINQEISLTGTYNFTESGHYFSVVSGGGQEMLEGSPTSYGTFSGEGGLGLGFFKPSLNITFQQGAQALNSYDATLSLNFQLCKELEVGPMLEGNPESHQGPLSEVLKGTSDKIDEIDSVDWTAGLVATVTPWDFLEFSLTGEEDYSRTYLWQNILHTALHDLNETDRIPSVTLACDLTFLTDFVLALSIQEGLEYFLVGINYSPILKQTVNFTVPTTVSFSGYSFGLTYNL